MNGVFYVGATGLRSQEQALGVVANNIANINTPAYKRSEASFSELVTPPDNDADLEPAAGSRESQLSGVTVDSSSKVFTQGDLKQTGKSLDIAISGEGFLELLGPGGQQILWRGGTLKVGADGMLGASNGMPLKAMISVPADATAITIGNDGKVRAIVGTDAELVEIGQIDLALARNTGSLSTMGDGLYGVSSESDVTSVRPGEEGGGLLVQGSIETSNVQLSDEMVMLMLMQRAYAANAQVVQAGDQLMAIANGLKR